jgi:hypothetical protein
MATYPGTFIPIGQASNSRLRRLIDKLLLPRIMSFRMISMHDLPMALDCDGVTWRAVFGNWLQGFGVKARKNESPCPTVTDVDWVNGTFQAGAVDVGLDNRPRDNVEATYQFDYFPVDVEMGFLNAAVEVINSTAVGPMTNYKLDGSGSPPPDAWDGILVDLAYAMCIEKLLLDFDLWKYRLVYAVGPNEVYESGGGDIAGQLTTLKQNSEDRANKAMDNPLFKCGQYLSRPTIIYYNSIRGLGGASGPHGIPFVGGRLNGWKPNRWI